VERLTFTNAAGQEVTFKETRPLLLLSIAGTGAPETDVQMQKAPFQDGQTYIDSLLEPRALTVQAAIFALTSQEIFERRRDLSRAFNPKLGPGRLRYEHDAGVVEIEAVPEAAPVFLEGSGNRSRQHQKVLISLLCPDPFWYEPDESFVWLSGAEGGLRFPIRFPLSFAQLKGEVTVENRGDAPTPVLIEFYGQTSRPKVENVTTGQHIEVNQDIAAGEKLVINTAFGQKTVRLVDAEGGSQNAMHYITLESEFWHLEPGKNLLRYSSLSAGAGAKVSVVWKDRYVGV